VRRTERDGRSVQLVLINGFQVPVARNRVAELKAAGWLTTPGDKVPER
jgi:DNA-binding LytR/AlgR family response regulator